MVELVLQNKLRHSDSTQVEGWLGAPKHGTLPSNGPPEYGLGLDL